MFTTGRFMFLVWTCVSEKACSAWHDVGASKVLSKEMKWSAAPEQLVVSGNAAVPPAVCHWSGSCKHSRLLQIYCFLFPVELDKMSKALTPTGLEVQFPLEVCRIKVICILDTVWQGLAFIQSFMFYLFLFYSQFLGKYFVIFLWFNFKYIFIVTIKMFFVFL